MTVRKQAKGEEKAYDGKPLEDMTLQDALIAVAAYAARESEPREVDAVKRVAEHAGEHPLFKESDESLYARINHLINQMRTESPRTMLSRAARALTPELRETGFRWATAIMGAHPGLSAEKRAVLEQLQVTLAIPAERAENMMQDPGGRG